MTNLKIGTYGVVRQLFAYTIIRVPSTHLYLGQSPQEVGLHTCFQEGKELTQEVKEQGKIEQLMRLMYILILIVFVYNCIKVF